MDARKKKSHDDGMMAEGVAEIFLRAKGFKMLARRYRAGVGEIDLVALDDEYLVFIEVKARQSIEEALFSITPKMRARLLDAAVQFVGAHPEYAGRPMRFDVMAVKLPFKIHHLENALMQ
jgi:putative endonuclease